MKRMIGTATALILSAAIPSAAICFPTLASAEVGYSVIIDNRPPPPRRETVPPPRRGYEWAPGYWNWNGRKHQWVRGRWVGVRQGHYYRQPEWRQEGDRWQLNRGGWQRGDRDRDGIPNRQDRDRDGDGTPNRNDRRPDNPNLR